MANPPTVTAPADLPNISGFKSWLRQNMNQEKRNLVGANYYEFLYDLDKQDWPAFEAGCNYVRATVPVGSEAGQLSAAAWNAFKAACVTYNIPVTLT